MWVVPEKPGQPRKLIWLVDAPDRLTSFPPALQYRLGFALYPAQIGKKHEGARPARIRGDRLAGAGRRFERYQPRSSGIATPERDVDLIRQRLKLARRMASKKGD